jgi:hypothetical protein
MIKLADINGCSAVGLLVMMYPILCKVQYESLHQLLTKRDLWKQIGFSVIVNWIIAPFLMVRFTSTSRLVWCTDPSPSLGFRGHFSRTRAISESASSSWVWVDASPWYALILSRHVIEG